MPSDSEANKIKGIPNGALTVLIIAAITVISIAITLVCMLVNNRRARRTQQRVQQMTLSTRNVSLSSNQSLPSIPSTPHNDSTFPMYITPAPINSKFDAPPSYEEATRSVQLSPILDVLNPLDSRGASTPARIEVEVEMADIPSTSSSH